MSLWLQTVTFNIAPVGSDAMAGETRSPWSPVSAALTNVACSIQKEMGSVVDLFLRRGLKISHSIYSKISLSAVQIGMQAVDQDGKKYVIRFFDDMAGRGKVWCVYVDLIV